MSDPEIRDLPACREMARDLAAYLLRAVTGSAISFVGGSVLSACEILLSDLDRPESRDAWVRHLENIAVGWDFRQRVAFGIRLSRDRDNPAALRAAILATR